MQFYIYCPRIKELKLKHRMKGFFYIFLLAAAVLTGCKKDEVSPRPFAKDYFEVTPNLNGSFLKFTEPNTLTITEGRYTYIFTYKVEGNKFLLSNVNAPFFEPFEVSFKQKGNRIIIRDFLHLHIPEVTLPDIVYEENTPISLGRAIK